MVTRIITTKKEMIKVKLDFIAIDIETANRNKSICSIGAAKYIDGNCVDEFYSLINPEEDFDKFNISIHHIKPENVTDAPTYPTIINSLLSFIDTLPVVAHNAAFDIGCLEQANKKYNVRNMSLEYFCTYKLFQKHQERSSYSLKSLAKDYHITLKHHQALSDAKACGELVKILAKETQTNTIMELMNKCSCFKFGKLIDTQKTKF